MTIKNTLGDNRTRRFPFPASTAVSIYDLLYWDSGANQAKPLTSLTTGASEIVDQATVATKFLGVSMDVRLATEIDANAIRVVALDAICEVDVVSFTPGLGNLLGATWNGGSALVNQVMKQVTIPALAIAEVIGIPTQSANAESWGNAATTVLARITSRLAFNRENQVLGLGGQQGTGATTLTDAAQTLTLAANPILNMVPTAARNVTLPNEALAAALGLEFFFTNNSAGAFSVTFLGSGGGSIKGNGVCPQNKTIQLWCDGTNWNGMVSA